MAAPHIGNVIGFIFPRDEVSAVALRNKEVDETCWIDAIALPLDLRIAIRSPRTISRLKNDGFQSWPQGELSGDSLQKFIDVMESVKNTETLTNAEKQLIDKTLVQLERSKQQSLPVMITF